MGNTTANTLTQEQVTEYKGVFEMFDEEGNGEVKTQELERLMSLMGINPTKRELIQMAKDVDKDGKGIFNCESFLGLMALYHERAKNQDAELRAAFKVFDKDAKGYIDWDTLKYVLMNAGEPLNAEEAEQMMKEADKDGDGTIDYEGKGKIQTANTSMQQSDVYLFTIYTCMPSDVKQKVHPLSVLWFCISGQNKNHLVITRF
ncbi:calmodulin-like protein 6 [Arapaima gigas]